jgi:hypothetical protein
MHDDDVGGARGDNTQLGPVPLRHRIVTVLPVGATAPQRKLQFGKYSDCSAIRALIAEQAVWSCAGEPSFLFTSTENKRRKSANTEGTSAAMRWFRSRRLAVTWLALFALTSHFAHTFGHVHLDRFADHGLAAGGRLLIAAATGLAAPDQLPQRDKDAPIRLRDGFCAICGSISLAGTAFMPRGPSVVAPDSSANALKWLDVAAAASSVGHFHFDARGPPSA